MSAGGAVAVAARTLFDIVRNLPEGDVTFAVDGNHTCEIRGGKVRYKIPGLATDDFPPLPNPGDAEFFDLDVEVVGDLISKTAFSMSSDDTRPHLAGALFEGEGSTLRMVTTDGHRLSKVERQVEGASFSFSMLVPNKGVTELKRLLEDPKPAKGEEARVAVATAGANAFFRRDGGQLNVKLADEQFPPYDKVIPAEHTRRVVAAREGMVEALRRIALVSNEKSGGVRLQLDPGVLHITSENPDIGEGSEDLDVDYAGDAVTIGFNARYLLDALGALSTDEVVLELSGELDPGVVRPVGGPADFIGVVMPMRI